MVLDASLSLRAKGCRPTISAMCGKARWRIGPDGRPYLEVHHVRKLAEKGADSIENAVAACPNCHHKLHYGQNSKSLIETLYEKIPRLKRQ
ncbi:HNH endonuclease signature motif containing protein [Burkholderia sp. AU30280]|uniref:HNH endonuclease signature motif containing protein n=1 Tax=Burkholderia sp. AU30280 TaxID=2879628 RepID=UPI00299D0E1A|nr:HNH endonuclease signature motif containing protein [Burkholderia sp. AU30280]